jgi:hypothetical protein
MKNIRLATNKALIGQSYEFLEIDPSGVLWWKAGDGVIESGFMIDEQFAIDFFKKQGRVLDWDKLPKNAQKDPYEMWK